MGGTIKYFSLIYIFVTFYRSKLMSLNVYDCFILSNKKSGKNLQKLYIDDNYFIVPPIGSMLKISLQV